MSDPESPTPVNGAADPLEILPGYCGHSAKLSSCTSNWETALRKETRTPGREDKSNQHMGRGFVLYTADINFYSFSPLTQFGDK